MTRNVVCRLWFSSSVLLSQLAVVCGDVYMNNPRGSNNKLAEVNNNAENQNRLFDSQNNAAGGYQVGDNCVPNCKSGGGAGNYDASKEGSQEGMMYYYHGSELTVEFTVQHGCGTPGTNTACQVVVQYMCESDVRDDNDAGNDDGSLPGLRDGKDPPNSGRRRTAGGDTTNAQGANKDESRDPVRGRHETFESYDACRKRQRNKGLYVADQNLNNDIGATATRQNRNGNRRGLECPEEKDYYPYWHPSEWRDAAVLTSRAEHCEYYRRESQNVRPKGYCDPSFGDADVAATLPPQDQVPNNARECLSKGYEWHEKPAWSIPPPDCFGLPESRDNHHGNIGNGKMASYIWTVPDTIPDNDICVLRLRYNISTADFMRESKADGSAWDSFFDLDASFNVNPPLKTNPKDDFVGLGYASSGPLQLQVNTAQFGRTFQDRSHAFRVKQRPAGVPESTRIVNYNVRGRRGNIVQVYPAVEYDFVPKDLEVELGDMIHFQWAGSDANSNNNAGNGKGGTDRSNLVQIADRASNKPVPIHKHTLFFDAQSASPGSQEYEEGHKLVERFAFLDQEMYAQQANRACPKTKTELQNADLDDNDDGNCHQLNAAPAYFDGGLVEMRVQGEHHIASTRNNAYSNRSQKATIRVVMRRLRWHEALLLSVGLLAFLVAACFVGHAMWALMNPTSAAFASGNRPLLLGIPCCAPCVRRKVKEREAFKAALRAEWRQQRQQEQLASICMAVQQCTDSQQQHQQQQQQQPPAGTGAERPREVSAWRKSIANAPRASAQVELQVSDEASPKRVQAPRQRCMCVRRAARFCGLSQGKDHARDHRALLLYLSLNVLVSLVGIIRNLDGGFNRWYAMAKCGGYLLDFNLSVLLLPTMRSLQKYAIQVRALDSLFNSDPIGFHMMVAGWVALGTSIHVLGHVMHMQAIVTGPRFQVPITPQQEASGTPLVQLLFDPSYRAAPFTGIVILQFMAAMALTASPRVRRYTFRFGKMPTSLQDVIAWVLLILAGILLFPWIGFYLMWHALRRGYCKCEGFARTIGGFKIFWDVHKLWAPCYALLLIHGPQCWIWFLWPLVLLVCDRLVSQERRKVNVVLKSAELLNGPVLKLTCAVPKGFVYQAGQYVQLCCDQVNGEEWHPFTLTSAPEEETISVHIRCPNDLDWCSALRRKLLEEPVEALTQGACKPGPGHRVIYSPFVAQRVFSEAVNVREDGEEQLHVRPEAVEVLGKDMSVVQTFVDTVAADPKSALTLRAGTRKAADADDGSPLRAAGAAVGGTDLSLEDMLRPALPRNVIRLRYDGPHGAPSELVWKHKVVMLVGAGIGVTPFASILRSLQMQVRAQRGQAVDRGSGVTESQACQHVYFYWLCRGQDEFYWFYDLLNDALQGPARDRIEVNLFQTAEVELSQVRALGDGFHQFMGRPNWRRVFPKLAEKHPGEQVGVFLCGPQALRGELQTGADNAASVSETGTRFKVHAENF